MKEKLDKSQKMQKLNHQFELSDTKSVQKILRENKNREQ